MPRLYEKYQPRTLADFVGQPKVLATLQAILARPDFDGDAFWIVGPSGTGKTTLAEILAARFAAPANIVELDGERCDLAAVRQLAVDLAPLPLFRDTPPPWRVWIVNEAQAMTERAVQGWLTVLGKLPPRVLVIFTTTSDSADLFGEFESPFRSRCKSLEFTNQGLAKLFASRCKTIAEAEHLDGQPLARYERLAYDCRLNLREMLQRIETGAMLVPEPG